MRIDAHQHFWQLGRFEYRWLQEDAVAAIRRDFLPADLRPLIAASRIDRTVFVQTQHNLAENDWALQLASDFPFVAGVVGWVDLTSPHCEEQLLRYAGQPKFVGVRHITQDEPDNDFIVRPDVLQGLKVLQRHSVPFDLLFHVRHLRHATALASRLPNLPMVIDHLAKPHIRARRVEDWESSFRQAARCENMFCKLSGMVTEADHQRWTIADLKPYVDVALEAFGPRRLMFGSDWPVCNLAADYGRVHDGLQELLADLSPTEQSDIFGGTAIRFYKLKV